MSFKFALGAAVVLVTSAALVREDLEFEQEERNRPPEDQEDGDGVIQGLRAMRAGIVEEGQVIGRSEYLNGAAGAYLVRYRAGDGRQVEDWFSADALTTRKAIEAEFAQENDPPLGFDQAAVDRDMAG